MNNKKDFEINGEKLYSISEMAKISGLGRSTLLRLEEYGIDKPRYINSKNGYRYYDVVNVHNAMQYQMFQRLGLSVHEIASYYNGTMNKEETLDLLRDRLAIAQRTLDEFESRFTERGSLSFSHITIPAYNCFHFSCDIENPKDQIEYNYRKIQEMYEKGFRPYPTTPMFSVVPDFDSAYEGKNPKPFRSEICVTVFQEEVPDPDSFIRFRSRNAFSLLYHGNDTEIMNAGAEILYKEMKKRGIRSTGPVFGFCIVGPFFGTGIDPEDYLFRWAIPVD